MLRSAIHRLLAGHGIARMSGSSSQAEEKRSFVAESAGAIWYGDVMHGPRVIVEGKPRKAYLVSLFDDASRLVTHSAFCLGETALDIEGVLKQATANLFPCWVSRGLSPPSKCAHAGRTKKSPYSGGLSVAQRINCTL
uniref:hypothetical protein n=1 Tax=Massilia genomosp. 1 TaxID=2609280 RepID=UPI001E3DAF92|nr:hypothetical protein [Massilia genomosp. 1]